MSLRKLQSEFISCVAVLIIKANDKGYDLTFGDAYRSPQECQRLGFENSCHGKRLAVDLNLFKDGQYLTDTDHWKELGEYWETLHELARWGGRFGDGNHLSFEYQGVK